MAEHSGEAHRSRRAADLKQTAKTLVIVTSLRA